MLFLCELHYQQFVTLTCPFLLLLSLLLASIAVFLFVLRLLAMLSFPCGWLGCNAVLTLSGGACVQRMKDANKIMYADGQVHTI